MASQPDLTNIAISSGYATLIHTEESGGVSTSYTNLYDGDGTLIPISVATTGVKIIDGSYDFDVASHDGTNGLKLGGTLVTASATELNYLDISSLGSAQASKVLTTDSNIDVSGIRNLTGTGTAQFANFTATGDTTIGDSVASDSVAFNSTITTNLVFEGSTANAYETTLSITDPTADRTWTIPDATDTSVGRATTDTLTNKTLTAPDINTPDIDGGTVDAITSLTVANNVDIGSYDLRAGTLTADGLTSGRVVFAGTNGVLSDDSDVSFSGATLSATNLTSSGTVTYGSLSDGSITITAFVDEDGMDSNSATLIPTQQSVKAYVDAQVTAQDLDFQGDSGGALNIDLDSETLDIAGGTGIDTSGSSNTLTVAIDSTVATLTGSQTLTNKTLASPVITTQFNIGSATITEAELEILDGATSTTAELNILDGDTSATGTTLADADRVVVNDNGTMVQVALTDFETYFESALDTLSNVTTLGTVGSGAISSGFGNIDIGSSNLTATGTISLGATSFNDNNITNVGDINVDSVSSDDGSGFDLILDDNKTTALEIKEGSTAYLTFVTTDSGEKITLGKKLEAGSVEIEGSAFDINGGTIDGATIATSDVTVGSGKTLDVSSGTLTLANNQISGDKVEGGTIASTTITALTTAGVTASANLDIGSYTLRASNFLADSQTATQVAFYGTDGLLAGDSDMTFAGSTLTVTDLTVGGTLTTTGTVQEVSTTNLNVQDPLILLNKYDSQPTNNAYDAGIVIKRGSGDSAPANVAIIWDESANTFSLVDTSEDGTTAGNVSITDYENLRVGALTADDASTFTSTISTATGSTIGNLTLANGSITDSSGAISFGNENLSTTGTLSAGAITGTSFVIGSADIGEAELEILDGATVTTDELNLIDGGTARGTTAVASGDGILINDAGTMRMTNVDTVSTYFSSHNVGGSNIVTTGALASGSIASGFGAISTGNAITTTGVGTFASLDISGNVDVDGTLEADAITVDSVALATYIRDTVGTNMLSSNTESGITVTYDTSNDNIDFAVDASQTGLTSILNASLVAGRDADNQIKFSTDDEIIFRVAGGDGVTMKASGEIEATSLDISGAIDVDGTANLDAVDIDGAVQIDSTLTVGVDDTGHDVIFYGDTASSNMTWDTSGDDLILNDARLFIDMDDTGTYALEIDHEGQAYNALQVDASNLTTGSCAMFYSNATRTADYPLVEIQDDNPATGDGYGLKIRVDGDGDLIRGMAQGNNTKWVVKNDGKMGIGQETPQTDNSTAMFLHIGSSSNASAGLVIEDNERQWEIQNNGNLNFMSGTTNMLGIRGDNGNSEFAGTVQATTITSYNSADGIVSKRNDGTDTKMQILNTHTGSCYIYFDASNGDLSGSDYAFIKHDNSNLNLVIQTEDGAGNIEFNSKESSTMTLDGANVGIGTGSPGNPLHLFGDSVSSLFKIQNDHESHPQGMILSFSDASPDNNTQEAFKFSDNANNRCIIWSDGDVQNNDNSYGSLSDARAKQGIRDANSQWDDIKAIKVRNFKKTEDVLQYGDKAWEQIGVVAQELEESGMDKLVREHPADEFEIAQNEDINEGDMVKSVVYSIIYMKAIKALQEAMQKIETLETKVETLENK